MANDLSAWPWIIDTPGATILVAGGIILKRIRWVSKLAVAGDDVLVTDTADRAVWASVAPGGNYVESELIENAEPLRGLKVPILDSGTLYIYYEQAGRTRPWRG